MDVAIVVGHTRLSKGAYSRWFNKKEYDFWKGFECELRKVGDVFYHNHLIYGYNSRQKAMAKKTKDYDVVFEVHFNSFKGETQGCEALYYHTNEKTKEICDKFCFEYSRFSDGKNRGSKPLSNKNQRGFGFVYYQETNAVILEPFFGDNYTDCSKFEINKFIDAIKLSL